MSEEPTARANRPAIRMHQTHDASGVPAPAEFLEHLPTPEFIITIGSATMRFLSPLNPSRSDRDFVYFYSDPARGSGWLELEGFSPADARRVQELVRMEEIVRVVGPEPRKNVDLAVGRPLLIRANNPWIIIAYGTAIIGLGLWVFVQVNDRPALFGVGLFFSIVFVILGGILVFLTQRRVGWWHRARVEARRGGESMPPDLATWS
jgi:hypothetical protein